MQRPREGRLARHDILVLDRYFAYDSRLDALNALASAYVEMSILDQKPDLSAFHTENFLPPRQ